MSHSRRPHASSSLTDNALRKIPALALITVCLSLSACTAEPVRLAPNAQLRFEFPELPDTLLTMFSGDKKPAMLTATLPANYTPERQFPLFVYLIGSEGGRGDTPGMGRAVVGNDDFICVSLPLFKRRLDTSEVAKGRMISMDDYAVISSSYRVMLQKLLDAVPNITPERSTFGGFSNGGHTTGVLIAGQDDFLFEHFRQFYLMEGGVGPLMANVMHKKSLTHCRFLLLRGDAHGGPDAKEPPPFEAVSLLLEQRAQRQKLDFTSLVMRGYGHVEPKPYLAVIGQWTRGETLSEVPPKPPEAAPAPHP